MRGKGAPAWLVLLAVVALVAAACGSEDAVEDTTTTTTAEATTTTAADDGDTTTTTESEAEPDQTPESVTVGLGNMPQSGMPYLGAGSPGQYVWSNIFDALTRIDADGTPEPWLAESWSTADDNLTWTFNLRPGVT